MFEKILLATTASPVCEHAANVAFDLARKYNSRLYVLHVAGEPRGGSASWWWMPGPVRSRALTSPTSRRSGI